MINGLKGAVQKAALPLPDGLPFPPLPRIQYGAGSSPLPPDV